MVSKLALLPGGREAMSPVPRSLSPVVAYNPAVGLAPVLAVRLLRRRGTALLRTSAIAALVAVVLGVAALVVVLALMTGYSEALRRGILAGGGHAVALFPSPVAPAELARYAAAAAAIPGVAHTAEASYLPALLYRAGAANAEIVTVKATTLLPPFASKLVAGEGGPLGIALGGGLARRLDVKVGDALTLQVVGGEHLPTSLPARVEEVFRTGFAELDERWAVTRLDAVRARVGGVAANVLEVWLDDPDAAGAKRDAIDRACEGKALVTTWQENNRNLFAALRWQKLSLAVVLSLVLGVGAFEVASALVVLVTEKRRELGVLMALGAEPRLVRSTLLLAGGALGGLGVVLGIVVGLGLVALLDALGVPHFPPDIAAIYMVDRIPLIVRPADLAVVVGLGGVEVLLAALLPAHRAAAREPVEILRWV